MNADRGSIGSSACGTQTQSISMGCSGSVHECSLNERVSKRKLSWTGIELERGNAAEYGLLDPVNLEERPLTEPVKVGRTANHSKRDQLAIQRLLLRV